MNLLFYVTNKMYKKNIIDYVILIFLLNIKVAKSAASGCLPDNHKSLKLLKIRDEISV